MSYMTHEQALARAALIKRMEDWHAKQDAVTAERDALIREGSTDGMPNSEVAEHIGISRTTVIRVLGANSSKEG